MFMYSEQIQILAWLNIHDFLTIRTLNMKYLLGIIDSFNYELIVDRRLINL